MKSAYLLAALLVTAACDSDSPTRPVEVDNDLVFTRADGSQITFAGTPRAWCGPWEEGEIEAPSVRVLLLPSDFGSTQPYWTLSSVRSDIQVGQPQTFPNDFVFDQPEGTQIFVFDPPNEASTAQAPASGSITFERVDCSIGAELRFTVDAVLGSEFGDGPTIRIRGRLSVPIGLPPFTLD